MSILSKLFGGGGSPAQGREPEIYKDFRIYPEPVAEGGQHRIAARIEKEVGGEIKIHRLIRADTLADAEEAAQASVAKARQLIDEQGERLF